MLQSNRGSVLVLALAVAGLFAPCLGCGKKIGPAFDLTPAAGTVTLDGRPLADANIALYFQGAAPKGYYGSGAATDGEGKFHLMTGAAEGALPGTYKVTVSRLTDAKGGAIKLEEGMDMEQLNLQGQVKESLPAKYSNPDQTELTMTVEKSKSEGYNIELKSA